MDGLYSSFVLLAVPLFIIAANIMNAGTISDRLLGFCVALVGRFRGGLGHVNVVASLIFSGMSGSAVADAAGIGKIIIEMMTKSGHYTRGYAAAITAASATIGPIIPPSIPMVLYALVAGSNASIGYLFLGGIVPGLLMGMVLMGMNTWLSHRRGFAIEGGCSTLRTARAHRKCLSRTTHAGNSALRHLWRCHDPDRGSGGRSVLCTRAGRLLLPRPDRRDAVPNSRAKRTIFGRGRDRDRRVRSS